VCVSGESLVHCWCIFGKMALSGLVLVWCWSGAGLVLVWFRSGFGQVLVWSWRGTGSAGARIWLGIGVAESCARCLNASPGSASSHWHGAGQTIPRALASIRMQRLAVPVRRSLLCAATRHVPPPSPALSSAVGPEASARALLLRHRHSPYTPFNGGRIGGTMVGIYQHYC
jgi:hypothetical protein